MLCEALYGRGAIIVGPRHGTQLDLCLPAPRHNKQGAVYGCAKIVGPRNGRVWMRTKIMGGRDGVKEGDARAMA